MKVSEFDYHLPDELIAQDPLQHRDQSRLMIIHKDNGTLEHENFRDIVHYLRPGDVLVLNETRVIPARLIGFKESTGGQVEVLLIREKEKNVWEALVKPGRRTKPGSTFFFGGDMLKGTVLASTGAGIWLVRFESRVPFSEALSKIGKMPLPPYIKKYPEDPQRYQTVYARREGSVAAPTAGLHFTGGLLADLKSVGIHLATVLLHVGPGTFMPVRSENVEEHLMHEEYYEIPVETADLINAAVNTGRRIIAVGTTTVRCLETGAQETGQVMAGSGYTSVFIYPGYKYRVVKGMVTNFHLPKSTLIMMVSALAGRDLILKAYREAVERRYRFYSFGDAMLIL